MLKFVHKVKLITLYYYNKLPHKNVSDHQMISTMIAESYYCSRQIRSSQTMWKYSSVCFQTFLNMRIHQLQLAIWKSYFERQRKIKEPCLAITLYFLKVTMNSTKSRLGNKIREVFVGNGFHSYLTYTA